MASRAIAEAVYWVGAIDWDRRMFDALIPLPDGTSYNAYLVRGSEATALVDTVDPTMTQILQRHLNHLDVDHIEYVVANHAEQDHSGSLPTILERYPMAKVLCTPRCVEMLVTHLHLAENRIVPVEDGETVSLGGRTLEFIHAPWVHWPETMLTYLREDKILFSCDLFGSHLATSELYATNRGQVREAAKRYYAEIMMPFARNIGRHLERLSGYDIEKIAPSHGPIYNNPKFITDLYDLWVNARPGNQAIVAYISMHGSTSAMTQRLVEGLTARGVPVKQFDLSATDLGRLAQALVDSATLLVGTPTLFTGAHPSVAYAVQVVNALRPALKFIGIYGSYGWSTRVDQQIVSFCTNLRAEMLDPVLVKGMPTEEELAAVDALAETVARKHKEAELPDLTPESH